jgi:proteasome lid subunit RPN8/RPN11
VTVFLPAEAARAIIEHARRELPLEACGLLGGRIEGSEKKVERVYPVENLAKSPVRFDIGPKDQLRAVLDMRKLGLVPLGNYHSHPETPARPSREDLRLFVDPAATYLIVSLAQNPPAIKAFRTDASEAAGYAEERLETGDRAKPPPLFREPRKRPPRRP